MPSLPPRSGNGRRPLGGADEHVVRELPLTLLRSLASPLRDLELRHAGRTLLLALVVGSAVGLVACAFLVALHLAERVLLHELAGYQPMQSVGEAHMMPAPKDGALVPWLLVLVPAAGGLVTGLLGHYLAPEILGGGGNAYIAAFHQGGFLRRRVLTLKLAASVSTLGSGGSGGREGPTMLIGAAVGNLIGRALRLPHRDRRLLLVAGTAGGLAAIFGTPLGAGLLAAEVLYRDDFESDALVPAILSSVTAYSVFHLVFPGQTHLFAVAARYPFEPHRLWLYALLALFASLAGHLFIVQMHAVRRVFERSRLPRWIRPALGGLALGLLAVAWIEIVNPSLGLQHGGIGILGSGYGVAQSAILERDWMPPGWQAVVLFGALAVVKMLATALTLESGGSAGDFGPSMAIGALLGGAFGRGAALLLTDAPDPGAFALVGMAAFYGGLAHAPLAAVIMVCEMAGSYDLLVPLMLSVGLSYPVLRRVHLYPAQVESRAAAAGEASLLDATELSEITTSRHVPWTVPASAAPEEVHRALSQEEDGAVVVVDAAGRVAGVIERSMARDGMLDPALSHILVASDLATPLRGVKSDAKLSLVLATMLESNAHFLPIVDADDRPVGMVSEHEITKAYYAVLAARKSGSPGARSDGDAALR